MPIDFGHRIATFDISLHIFSVAQILVVVGHYLVRNDLLLAVLNLVVR